MDYKKSIIVLLLAIFLFSITGVCASEIDTPIASEDTNQIGLLDNDKVEDNGQTSGKNTILEQTNNVETLNDENEGTYSDLRNDIHNGGILKKSYYRLQGDEGLTIEINTDAFTVEGNGAVIDMGSAYMRAFYVYSSGVTFKNLTIKNAKFDGGGAIYFSNSGIIENCNFTNNTGVSNSFGGAVYFQGNGTVTNCNFNNNTAFGSFTEGGAVYFFNSGAVTNCNFTANAVTNYGGAVSFKGNGTLTNCNFYNNSATISGGAAMMQSGIVENCNFAYNHAADGGAVYFADDSTVRNCNFTLNTASDSYNSCGGALCFLYAGNVTNCNFNNNTAASGGAVYMDSGIVENCNFTDNKANYSGALYIYNSGTVRNCNFTANTVYDSYTGCGGAIYLDHEGTVINCNFIDNHAHGSDAFGGAIFMVSGSVENCNFIDNHAADKGGAVYILDDGDVRNCNFTACTSINGGAVCSIVTGTVSNCNFTANTAFNGGAVYFLDTGNVSNCNFTDNHINGYKSRGGAIYMDSGSVENCNFTANTANGFYSHGGAVSFLNWGDVRNCSFTANTATDNESMGGAVSMDYGTVTDCNFTGNNATTGSAIYFESDSDTKSVFNSIFLNNRANAKDLQVTKNENNITIIFTGNNNLLNAIFSYGDVNFTNVTYWGVNITNTGSSLYVQSISDNAAGQNITVKGVVNGNIINAVMVTDENGTIILDDADDYWIVVSHKEDSYYTELAETLFTNMKLYANVTSITTNNKTVNITAKSNILNEFKPGKLLFILPNGTQINATYGANGTWWAEYTFDDYGEYNVSASYFGLDNVTVNNGTITINKVNSTITLGNITLNYGESKNVTVTTAGAVGITAKIDGSDVIVINNYTIAVSGLAIGNYTLTVTTVPDGDHNPVTATSKITVNKADSTLTVGNIVFDYGNAGSGDVSFTGASEVIANVVNQPSAVVSVNGSKISVSGLAAGTYTLNVTTVPDENHAAVTKTATITVNKVNSTLTVGNVELDYGETKNITATAEGATGITAKINGVNVTVKDYTITISGLGAGNYTLTVTTIPDNNHNPVTVTSKITVNKLSTEITLANETIDLKVNDEFAVLANLTPASAGNPAYSSSNESVVKVSSDGLITAVGKGTSTVTVSFAGNNNYTAAQNKTINVTVTLNDASISAEDITLVAGANATINAVSVPEGLKVTYIPDNSGVVTVKDGVVTGVKGGTATVTLKVGGDGIYTENSTTITVKVNKMPTKFADVVVDGNNVSLILKDAYGNAIPNANVSYDINGVSNTAVSDANGSFMIVGEPEALIVVDYTGSDVYVPSNITVKLAPVVVRQSTVILGNNFTQYAVDYNAGERGQNFTVQLKDVNGNVLANKTVLIGYNGKTLERTTNATGYASVQINLRDKNRLTFAVTFLGDKDYNATMSVYLITINQKPVTISAAAKTYKASAKTKKYTVTLKTIKGSSADGKTYFGAGKKVTIKINGKTYTAKTNSKGQATFSLKITKKGKFAATVKYAGDNTYKSASKNVKITIE